MKTTAAILILIANLWSLTTGTPLGIPLRSLFDFEDLGGITTQQDPPDDGDPLFNPPPR